MSSSSTDHRDRKCELGYLHRAEGSCLYSLGGTVVLASVNGPGDLRSNKQIYDQALIETNFQSKIGGSTNHDAPINRIIERQLRSICESCILIKQFPRSSIVITIQEMQDDGSLTASAINASCLALLDAGLPLRTVFAAVNCILISSNDGNSDILLVEPESKRDRGGDIRAKMLFIFESDGEMETTAEEAGTKKFNGSKLNSCTMEGIATVGQLKTAQEAAQTASKDVFRLYRSVVAKKCEPRVEITEGH